jgi:hypothetical protein
MFEIDLYNLSVSQEERISRIEILTEGLKM